MKDGIAMIHFRLNGTEYTWGVGGAFALDSEETLRAHLARWVPDADFLSVEIRQVVRRQEVSE